MRQVLIFLIFFTAVKALANGGKVETIRSLLKSDCRLTLQEPDYLRLVRDLYLICIPRTQVSVSPTCSVRCLKPTPGVVIGR